MAVSSPEPAPLRFSTYDVFTSERFAGNPLAIVEGADGLTTAQMQTIAREFNLSETIFVLSPANPAHTARVRIFFPTAEIPFAGHPTIGCAIHLSLSQAAQGDFETLITLEEEAGLVPVTVTRRDKEVRAEFVAPVLPHAPQQGTVPPVHRIANALDLREDQIGFGTHRPGLWQGGPAFLYVPVVDRNALGQARPLEPDWGSVMEQAAVDSAYLYTPAPGCDYRARMFSPGAGIPEDPATGSASAILAAQLHACGAVSSNADLLLLQGVEMGRRSEVSLGIEFAGETFSRIRVGGSAVPVSYGWIIPPQVGEDSNRSN